MEQRLTDDQATSKFLAVRGVLETVYGPRKLSPSGDPLSELISTILSQNTSDTNTARSFRSLRQAFPTWDEVRLADTTVLIDVIRSGGLANRKAPRIQAVLESIREQVGSENLSMLRDLPLADAKSWLTSLHGVGSKTAACVLLFSLGRPAMPVDTHVHRVSIRLGLVPPKTSPERTASSLEESLGDDPQAVYAFHMEMIQHGRSVCRALRPACMECTLRGYCDYFQQLGSNDGATDSAKAQASVQE
jgi:endonuclease-3